MLKKHTLSATAIYNLFLLECNEFVKSFKIKTEDIFSIFFKNFNEH